MTGRSPETCDGIAMTKNRTMLDLSNIQGNILRGYASFPHAQFLYLSIHSADDARTLLRQLLNTDSVTPAQWRVKPDATLNVALTFEGLRLQIGGSMTPKEHFGFVDGLTNPDVEGVPGDDGTGRSQDVGNPNGKGGFRKIPPGEFIIGYPGEGGELAPMALPHLLAQDASYLVFRKLEQDVPGFHRYLKQQAESFVRALAGGLPAGATAEEFLAAKMMGRWRDGSSLIKYPDGPGNDTGNAFAYADDPAGARCPLGAHVRRTNPRDSLGFGGRTMSRRRVIRRGIPYGKYLEPGKQDGESRGIIFIAFNSGFDQFEFVQQVWVNFGDDFEQGNDIDPIAGSRESGRMMIPGDEATGRRPFICFDIPRFVTTKGGDCFFVPSLAGLRLLTSGRVEVS